MKNKWFFWKKWSKISQNLIDKMKNKNKIISMWKSGEEIENDIIKKKRPKTRNFHHTILWQMTTSREQSAQKRKNLFWFTLAQQKQTIWETKKKWI